MQYSDSGDFSSPDCGWTNPGGPRPGCAPRGDTGALPSSAAGRARPGGTHLRILRAGWLNHVATRRCQSLWKCGFRIMPLRLGAMAARACGHGQG